jgi:hypothetical protein
MTGSLFSLVMRHPVFLFTFHLMYFRDLFDAKLTHIPPYNRKLERGKQRLQNILDVAIIVNVFLKVMCKEL